MFSSIAVTRWYWCVSATFLLLACQAPVPADRTMAITDGVPWTGHPAVGIVRGNGHTCTATLVGQRTVLTAAHCTMKDSGYTFEAEGQTYSVLQVHRHPGFDTSPDVLSLDDIALLRLEAAPPVAPAEVNVAAVYGGLEITLVGYGKTSETSRLGDKHMAKNNIDRVESKRFRFSGTGGAIGNTCLGDSGGPALATLSNKEVVVGVTSTSDDVCGVLTWDTRVDAYAPWLLSTSGGDLEGATPEAPAVSFAAPADGATVSSSFQVRLTVKGRPLAGVEIHVDGRLAKRLSGEPFRFDLTLGAGSHTLVAQVDTMNGKSASASITVRVEVATDASPPGDAASARTDVGVADASTSRDVDGERSLSADGADPGELSGGCAIDNSDAIQLGWVVLLGVWFHRRRRTPRSMG